MTTTRRNFLAAAGAIGAMAPFIKADDKTGKKLPILGEGEHKYECIHDWGELPSNIKYGNTHSVCEDAQGHIYIHHTVHKDSPSPDSVVVFDEKGKFVRVVGRDVPRRRARHAPCEGRQDRVSVFLRR